MVLEADFGGFKVRRVMSTMDVLHRSGGWCRRVAVLTPG